MSRAARRNALQSQLVPAPPEALGTDAFESRSLEKTITVGTCLASESEGTGAVNSPVCVGGDVLPVATAPLETKADESAIPLHHYPSTTGDESLYVTTDAWEQFFSLCWDYYEILMQRRAAKQAEAQRVAVEDAAGVERGACALEQPVLMAGGGAVGLSTAAGLAAPVRGVAEGAVWEV